MADWQISPEPALLDMVTSYLTIWAGSAGALESVGYQGDSFEEFLRVAVKVAAGGVLAEQMKNRALTRLSKVKSAANDSKQQLQRAQAVSIRVHGHSGPGSPQGKGRGVEALLIRLFRAIAAAVSNALKHAAGDRAVKISARTPARGAC